MSHGNQKHINKGHNKRRTNPYRTGRTQPVWWSLWLLQWLWQSRRWSGRCFLWTIYQRWKRTPSIKRRIPKSYWTSKIARQVKIIMRPPEIESSTEEERRQYIKKTFPCIADCDMCGLCTVFKGKDLEIAYEDYIRGKRSYIEVSGDYR